MTLKDRINEDMKAAMRAKEAARLSTLRLLLAAMKQKEVDERVQLDDVMVLGILEKMVKQRRESIDMYRKGGREELAAAEEAEVAVIERFLPAQLGEDETKAAIEAIKAEIGATGMKDMGRVMAELKARHGSQLDMSKASGWVKGALG